MLNPDNPHNLNINESSSQSSWPSSPILQSSDHIQSAENALTVGEAAKKRLHQILGQRQVKKIAKDCLKKWKLNKNLFIEKYPQFEEQSGVIFTLMTEVFQYMLNEQILLTNWRQIQISKIADFVARSQKIFEIVRKNNLQIYDLNVKKVVKESICCFKMIANELYNEKIIGSKNFINSLIFCKFGQLSSIIIAKLALNFTQQQSQLSVFSEQSFNNKAKEQRKSKKAKGISLAKLLSSQPIKQMELQIQSLKCSSIRNSCLNDLIKNFPQIGDKQTVQSALKSSNDLGQNVKNSSDKKQKELNKEDTHIVKNQQEQQIQEFKQMESLTKISSYVVGS